MDMRQLLDSVKSLAGSITLTGMALVGAIGATPVFAQTAPVDRSPLPTLTPGSNSELDRSVNPSIQPNISPGIQPGMTSDIHPNGIEPSAYTLGPGDRVRIDIFRVPDYSGEALVLPDGTLNLPQVGYVAVQGMTLEQATQVISDRYAPFLRRPLVTMNLVSLRPVRVAISGEINRPGSYIVSSGNAADAPDGVQFSTITEAIALAGGVTPRADLRQVQVYRQPVNGQAQVINIDLWQLLRSGDLSQDVVLQGGDTIVIPTATAIDSAEALELGSASFAPDQIKVYVVGEVVAPGEVSVAPNTPLNQALLAAGGFDNQRAARSSVDLVRLNPDGTASQRNVTVNFNQGVNEETNPALQNGDVIVVRRSGLARVTDSVNPILDAVGRLFRFGLF
jgi:polysaccharide biosynthesis/export protein